MKFLVNENCIGCGLCAATCPEVFEMDGAFAKACDCEVSGETEQLAAEAQNACPVGAIESH